MQDARKFYINGEWVSPVAGTDFEVINPSTEEPYAVVSLGGKEDAESAIAAAKANAKLLPHLEGKTIKREIYVPGKIVNIVAV